MRNFYKWLFVMRISFILLDALLLRYLSLVEYQLIHTNAVLQQWAYAHTCLPCIWLSLISYYSAFNIRISNLDKITIPGSSFFQPLRTRICCKEIFSLENNFCYNYLYTVYFLLSITSHFYANFFIVKDNNHENEIYIDNLCYTIGTLRVKKFQ